jgi:hypothetical protein
MPHLVLQGMFDALYPPGLQWYWKADFVRELSDKAIAQHTKYAAQLPTIHSTMHLYPIDDRAGRIKNSATPWFYSDAKWAQVMVGVDPDPGNKEKISAWAKDYWNVLHPQPTRRHLVEQLLDQAECVHLIVMCQGRLRCMPVSLIV